MSTLDFGAFLERELGTRDWCVASRFTDRLQRAGYKAAVSQKRYRALREQWERETYGGTLKQLHEAAPAMLAALQDVVAFMNRNGVYYPVSVDGAISAATRRTQ